MVSAGLWRSCFYFCATLFFAAVVFFFGVAADFGAARDESEMSAKVKIAAMREGRDIGAPFGAMKKQGFGSAGN